ncbi:hypothetical protein BJX66DRAFT_192713 [Aspergillus keveii]|uniref:Uncharacterized protein n=1 Tax=Aspergillus keveii TaxID=714993 RepID=A0ABR4FGV3_9EURO
MERPPSCFSSMSSMIFRRPAIPVSPYHVSHALLYFVIHSSTRSLGRITCLSNMLDASSGLMSRASITLSCSCFSSSAVSSSFTLRTFWIVRFALSTAFLTCSLYAARAALNPRCDVNHFVERFGFLLVHHGIFDLRFEDVVIPRAVCFVFPIEVRCNLVKFRGEFSNTHIWSLSKRIHASFSGLFGIRVPEGFGDLLLEACIGVENSISTIFPICTFRVFLKVSHEWLEPVKGGSSEICSSEKYRLRVDRLPSKDSALFALIPLNVSN